MEGISHWTGTSDFRPDWLPARLIEVSASYDAIRSCLWQSCSIDLPGRLDLMLLVNEPAWYGETVKPSPFVFKKPTHISHIIIQIVSVCLDVCM